MAMQGVEASVDANKKALLAAIAQQGTIGAQAYDAQAQRQAQSHQQAVGDIYARTQGTSGAVGAPSGVGAHLAGQQAALNSVYAQDAALSRGSYDAAFAATSGANSAYMNQARAAVPALRAQAEGRANIIRQELAAEAERRRHELEQMRLEAQLAEEERAFTREGWNHERALREAEAAERGGMSEAEAAVFGEAVEERRFANRADIAQQDPDGLFTSIYDTVTDDQPDFAGALAQARTLVLNETGGVMSPAARNNIEEMAKRLFVHYNPMQTRPKNIRDTLEFMGLDSEEYLGERLAPSRDREGNLTRPSSRNRSQSRSRGRDPWYVRTARDVASRRGGGGPGGSSQARRRQREWENLPTVGPPR